MDGETYYELDYPNSEVRLSMIRGLIRLIFQISNARRKTYIDQTYEALSKADLNQFEKILYSFYVNIPYDAYHTSHEKEFQLALFLMLKLLGTPIRVEEETNTGRIDILLEFPKQVYIIKFKVNLNVKSAIKHIIENKYWERFKDDINCENREIFTVSINFDCKKRNIAGFGFKKV